jgi:hypothetical protein
MRREVGGGEDVRFVVQCGWDEGSAGCLAEIEADGVEKRKFEEVENGLLRLWRFD